MYARADAGTSGRSRLGREDGEAEVDAGCEQYAGRGEEAEGGDGAEVGFCAFFKGGLLWELYTEPSRWPRAYCVESGERSKAVMRCGWRGLDVSGSEYCWTGMRTVVGGMASDVHETEA